MSKVCIWADKFYDGKRQGFYHDNLLPIQRHTYAYETNQVLSDEDWEKTAYFQQIAPEHLNQEQADALLDGLNALFEGYFPKIDRFVLFMNHDGTIKLEGVSGTSRIGLSDYHHCTEIDK